MLKHIYKLIFGMCLGSTTVLAQNVPVQLFPITDVVPEYPVTAIRDGREGWVMVRFTVTTAGGVASVRVSDSEPPKIFDDAALAAAQQFRFEPQVQNGQAIDVPDVGYVFRFDLSEEVVLSAPDEMLSRETNSQRMPPVELVATEGFMPLSRVVPVYPDQALEQRIGGWVVIRFTVTGVGSVDDAEVIDSEPRGVFDVAALEAIKDFNYEPRLSDGRAVNVRNVYHMFKFRPSM